MRQLMKEVRDIYEHLQDDESRFIYVNRVLCSITGNIEFINKIIQSLPQKIEMDRAIEECKNHVNNLVVWGGGFALQELVGLYPDFEFQLICDKDSKKQKEGWNGIPVISPERLIEKREEVYVAICTYKFHEEILDFLLENGFKESRLINLGAIASSLHVKEYFDENIVVPVKGEVFIDGGCYDCDTDKRFINWCSGDYKKIIGFEPYVKNYEKCLENCRKGQIKNIEILNKGLWNCNTERSFEIRKGQASVIIKNEQLYSEEILPMTTIDDVVGEDKVSFIKLDVEGAELEALQGGESTILKYKPRLAICIYHKVEDVIEIPRYILSLHSDYKLYVRHYQLRGSSTILYAV